MISEVLSYGAMQHGAKLYEGNLLGIDLYEANLEKVNLCGATVIAEQILQTDAHEDLVIPDETGII